MTEEDRGKGGVDVAAAAAAAAADVVQGMSRFAAQSIAVGGVVHLSTAIGCRSQLAVFLHLD